MSSEQVPNRYLRPILLIALLLGFGLRTFRLDYQELRGDETFGYFFSLPSFRQIVERTFELQEPHPVASYFVQSVWLDWAGHGEFALRFPSVWFSVLAIALLAGLARATGFRPTAAGFAAHLMALSPYAIWHAQDARMYSMSMTLTLASSWLFVLLVLRDKDLQTKPPLLGRFPLSVGYLVVTWLALHTHYFAAFIVIAQNLFVLFNLATRHSPLATRDLLYWISLQLLLSLAYLPWLLSARAILTGYGGNGDSPGFVGMLARSTRTFAFGETINEQWVWLALVALLVGMVVSLRRGRTSTTFLLLYWLVPLLATWASALQRPIFDERYLIAAAPPFLLLMGSGLASAIPNLRAVSQGAKEARWQPLLMLLSLAFTLLLIGGTYLSLSNHYTNYEFSKTVGWRQLATTFEQLSTGYPSESTRLIQNYPDPTLWYYYQGDVEHLVLPPSPNNEAGTMRELETFLEAAGGASKQVVLALQPADNWDNAQIAERALAEHFTLVAETTVSSWPIQVYSRPPDRLEPVDGGEFVNGLALSHASSLPSSVIAGGVLTTHLGWQALAAQPLRLTGSEKLFLHLVGPDGTIVGQRDVPLNGAAPDGFVDILLERSNRAVLPSNGEAETPAVVTSYGILLPSDAPLGQYQLVAGIYDPAQSGAPRVMTAGGEDKIILGSIEVYGFQEQKSSPNK